MNVHSAVALLCLCVPLVAQADFELQPGGCNAILPSPRGAPGDVEGLSWDGGTGRATIDDLANGCGVPTSGAGYLRVQPGANGGIGENLIPGVPPGPGNPFGGSQTETYIPIPIGATTVSLTWDFYTLEVAGMGFNDGMLVDAIDASGDQVLVLGFIDTETSSLNFCFDAGSCANFGLDTGSAGATSVSAVFIPSSAAWVRVAIWNGTDDTLNSDGVVDDVDFGFTPVLYSGTEEDLFTDVSIAGSPALVVGPGTDVRPVAPGDFVAVRHASPAGTFVGIGTFFVLGSSLPTGAALPFLFPGLHVNPATGFVLHSGVLGIPGQLSPFGFSYAFTYPGGIAGSSLYLQGIVDTATAANAIFAGTNGVELELM